jgi:sugar phosphate permease
MDAPYLRLSALITGLGVSLVLVPALLTRVRMGGVCHRLAAGARAGVLGLSSILGVARRERHLVF